MKRLLVVVVVDDTIEAYSPGAFERYSTLEWVEFPGDAGEEGGCEDFPIRFNGLKDALKENGTSTFQSCSGQSVVCISVLRVERPILC